MFFFQFLKLFPGYLEPVAAAVIPTIAVLLFIVFPLLDRNPERSFSRRKYLMGLGAVMIAVFIALEVTGALSAPSVPAGEESQQVQQGRQVYQQFNCAYCHAIGGVGGAVGPDVSDTGSKWNEQDLISYLLNPNSMIPQTLHPKLLFTRDEVEALTEYLLTLGAPVEYTPQAPVLFEQQCSSCHIVDGKGGTLGPDLSRVGSYRTLGFIDAFTSDPASVLPGATMPGYKRILSPEEIADIAAYLYSLK